MSIFSNLICFLFLLFVCLFQSARHWHKRASRRCSTRRFVQCSRRPNPSHICDAATYCKRQFHIHSGVFITFSLHICCLYFSCCDESLSSFFFVFFHINPLRCFLLLLLAIMYVFYSLSIYDVSLILQAGDGINRRRRRRRENKNEKIIRESTHKKRCSLFIQIVIPNRQLHLQDNSNLLFYI